MTAFIIFFIVLTILYVIYYAVMIGLDLRAKEKSDTTNEEESFDVSDIAGQAPQGIKVRTTESGDGFQVGDNPPQNFDPDDDVAEDYTEDNDDNHEPTAAEKHAEQCHGNMLEIETKDNDTYSYQDGSIQEFFTNDQKERNLIKEYRIHDKC